MSVKIELESSEIALIRNALGAYKDEHQGAIKTGKYKGRKISASAMSGFKNAIKKIEALEDFFRGLR